MKKCKKSKKMPIYWIKWLKMSTSGRPDQSSQMKSIGQNVSKNASWLNKMASSHFWSPCWGRWVWLEVIRLLDTPWNWIFLSTYLMLAIFSDDMTLGPGHFVSCCFLNMLQCFIEWFLKKKNPVGPGQSFFSLHHHQFLNQDERYYCVANSIDDIEKILMVWLVWSCKLSRMTSIYGGAMTVPIVKVCSS